MSALYDTKRTEYMAMATMPTVNKGTFSQKLIIVALVAVVFLRLGSVFFFVSRPAAIVNANPAAAPAANNPALASMIGATDRLLVWAGNGAAPGEHSSDAPGTLSFMDGTGMTTQIMEIPPQTSRIGLCGDGATSPDGQNVALYIGLDAGGLYLMKGADAPAKIADVEGLTCLGGGTFQFSPDGGRFAYIAYEDDAAQSEFADGFLHVANTGDLSEVYTYENVTAFDITNEGAAFVSFFTNDDNEADEAAVLWWSGSAEVEVATLQPNSEDCKFTSAEIAVGADGKYILVLGHRCTSGDTRTAWQLYSIDPSSRTATLAASEFQEGSFAPFARTNQIFFSPDGTHAYFTVPDGITANTVGIKGVGVTDMSLTDVVDRQVVMPTFNGSANAFPHISPDGKWLAVVVTSPDNTNTLNVYDLTNASVAPIVLEAGSQGDTISSLTFTPDSSRLVMIAGGDDTANNSLIAVDLATGNDFRIGRGRFAQGLTISPDGTQVAALDWIIPEDPQEPSYTETVVLTIDNSEKATLYTGAEFGQDGKITNRTFIEPLVWRTAQ
jgi:WD40 repeat protein